MQKQEAGTKPESNRKRRQKVTRMGGEGRERRRDSDRFFPAPSPDEPGTSTSRGHFSDVSNMLSFSL